jgi:hypothetical protein
MRRNQAASVETSPKPFDPTAELGARVSVCEHFDMGRSWLFVTGAAMSAVAIVGAACNGNYGATNGGDADATPSPDPDTAPETGPQAESGTDSSDDAPVTTDTGPFDANYYGNLELWLKADDGVDSTDGGGVTTWADRSLKKRQAAVPAVASPFRATCQSGPTFVPSALHGLPMVRFDGYTQCLQVDGAFANFTSGLTFFAVFQPETCNSVFTGNAGALFDTNTNSIGGYTEGIMIGRNPNPAQTASGDAYLFTTNAVGTGSVAITGGGSWVPAVPELLELRLPAGPGGGVVAATGFVNGVSATMNPNNPLIPDVDIARTTSFVGYTPGPSSGYPLFCGSIGELLVYAKALSDADRKAIESHLRARWGI